jgi:hypothetical protein
MLPNTHKILKLEERSLLFDDHCCSYHCRHVIYVMRFFLIIWFVRLLALRPLLAYCASLG